MPFICCFGRIFGVLIGRLFILHDEFPFICGVVVIRQLLIIDDDGVGVLIIGEFGIGCL
jgi:hypothetical protein